MAREKTGGRKKGTPNKQTELIREITKPLANLTDEFIVEHWKRFEQKMNALDDKDYCQIMAGLIKHRIPAYQSISFDKDTTEALTKEQIVILRMSQDSKSKEVDA